MKLDKNNLINIHNSLFVGALFSTILLIFDSLSYDIGGIIMQSYDISGIYHHIDISIPIDYSIPVQSWTLIFYASCFFLWGFGPLVIFVFYGPKNFSKFFLICLIYHFITLVIYIALPTSSDSIKQIGIDQLTGNCTKWLDSTELKMLISGKDYSYGCFPSNHCGNTLLVFFEILYLNYFDKANPSKNKSFIKLIITLVLGIYTFMVCMSTFLLKRHFFLDWIPALLISFILTWLINSISMSKISIWFLKLIINFRYSISYYDKNFIFYKQATFGLKNNFGIGVWHENKPFIKILSTDLIIFAFYILILMYSVIAAIYVGNILEERLYRLLTMIGVVTITIIFYFFYYSLSRWKFMSNLKPNKRKFDIV